MVEVDGETVVGGHVPVGKRGSAEVLDLGFVDREPWVGVDTAPSPRSMTRLEELRDHRLATGGDDHLGGVDAHASPRNPMSAANAARSSGIPGPGQ